MPIYPVKNSKKEKGYAHRLLMEKHLGRKLKDDEVVHHKNKDITDCRIENLQVMNRGKHASLHSKGRTKDKKLKRINFYIKEDQYNFVMNFDGLPFSEHARRAIDEYIKRLRPSKESASDSKRGDKDG